MQEAQARQFRHKGEADVRPWGGDVAGPSGQTNGSWGVGYYDGENCYLDGNDGREARHSFPAKGTRAIHGFDEAALAGSRAAAERFRAATEALGIAKQLSARALLTHAHDEPARLPAPGPAQKPVPGPAHGPAHKLAHKPTHKLAHKPRRKSTAPRLGAEAGTRKPRSEATASVDPVTAILARGVLLDEVALRKSRARRRRRYIQMLVVVCVFGFLMIYQFSVLVGVNSVIANRNAELARIEGNNSAAREGIDLLVDLEDVRLRAESQLGMQKPDRSQIYYITVPRKDHAQIEAPIAESAQQSMFEFIEEQARLLKERLFDGKKPND